MANKKVIAFSIEIDGKKNIKDVTVLFGLLEKQIKGVNKQLNELNKNAAKFSGKGLKETEKQLQKTGTSAKRLTTFFKTSFDQFDKGNKTVTDLGNGYFETTKAIEKQTKEVKENANSISDLTARNKELKKALADAEQGVEKIDFKGQTVEVAKLTKEFSKNNDAIKVFRTELRTGTKQQNIQKGSILDLRKTVISLKKEYLALTPAQRKALIGPSAKIRKELIKTTNQLKRQEEKIGDFRRSVGNYEKALKRVGRAAGKVFGIRGAFEGLRRVGQGLVNLVEQGAETNKVFAAISTATSGLVNSAKNFGSTVLTTFGSGIQKTIESVSFALFKISGAFESVANSGGIVGSIFSTIGVIISDFPSVLGGVANVFSNFFTIIGNKATDLKNNIKSTFLEIRIALEGAVGRAVSALERTLQTVNNELKESAENALGFGRAFNEGFAAVKKEQEDFTKRNNEETKSRERNEKARAAATEARKKAQTEEAERLKKLATDRESLREDLVAQEIARLQIIKTLGEQIIDLEISNQENRTRAAIDAENERFKRQQEARQKNFNQVKKDVKTQRDEVIRLNGEGSEQLKAFEDKTGKDIIKIKNLNNDLEAQQQTEHEKNLTSITKKAVDDRAKLQAKAFKTVSTGLLKGFALFNSKTEEVFNKVNEDRKKLNDQIKAALIDTANSVFDGINLAQQVAAEAENKRFEDAINARQQNIDKLNEDLENATGLQKKFLERQIEQEKQAQKELQKQAEKAAKDQAKAQQAVAIVQAVISTALAVTNALATPPAPLGIALAIAAAAAGAVEIATIASQKFAKGGVLAAEGGIVNGPSHAAGGVPFSIGGRGGFEAEGGEAIINKRSTAKFRPLLSRINQAGGGRSFQVGGITGAPISPPILASANQEQQTFDNILNAFNNQTNAINNRIDRIQVINSVDDFNDVNNQDTSLDAESTL
jgi:hypothetical protein